MEDTELTRVFGRRYLHGVVAALVICAFLSQTSLATHPKPTPIGRVRLIAGDIKLGSPLELQVTLQHNLKVAIPLVVKYYLPSEGELISSLPAQVIEPAEGGKVFAWKGIVGREAVQLITRFKVLKPGFYELHGTVELDEKRAAEIQAATVALAAQLPEPTGEHQKDGPSPQLDELLGQRLRLTPEYFFIRITASKGRIEDWDFGSVGKRLKHWFSQRFRRRRF